MIFIKEYFTCVVVIFVIHELCVDANDEATLHLNDLNMTTHDLSRSKRSILLAKAIAFGKGYLLGKAAGLSLVDYAYNYDESYIGYDGGYKGGYHENSYSHHPSQYDSYHTEPYSDTAQNQLHNTNYKTDLRVDGYGRDLQDINTMNSKVNGHLSRDYGNRGHVSPNQQPQAFRFSSNGRSLSEKRPDESSYSYREFKTTDVGYPTGYNYNIRDMAPSVTNGYSFSRNNRPSQEYDPHFNAFPVNSGNYGQGNFRRW